MLQTKVAYKKIVAGELCFIYIRELNKNALAVKPPYYKKRGCQIESDGYKALKKLYSRENAKTGSLKFKNGKSIVPCFFVWRKVFVYSRGTN